MPALGLRDFEFSIQDAATPSQRDAVKTKSVHIKKDFLQRNDMSGVT